MSPGSITDAKADFQIKVKGVDEVAVGRILEDIARGAHLERLEEVLLVVVHREHEDPDLRLATRELVCGLNPREPRHRHIEDGEVYLLPERDLDGFGAAGKLCYQVDKLAECVQMKPGSLLAA